MCAQNRGNSTYTYDGDGRRVIKTSGSFTTNYLYDPNGRLLTETVPGSTTTRLDYLYLLGDPLARVDWSVTETALTGTPGPLLANKASPNVHLDWTNASGSGSYVVRRKQVVNPTDKTFNGSSVIAGIADPTRTYDDPVLNDANRYDYRVLRKTSNDVLSFYHTDHLGTPIAMTDINGAPVWRLEHRPFGDGTPSGGAVNNLRFPGQYADSESGLFDNWHRSYRPLTGRYDEPDPTSPSAHLYLYAEARPTNMVDRSGLWPIRFFPPSPDSGVPAPTCTACSPNEGRIGSAVSKVCTSARGDSKCRQVLIELGLLDCFLKRCRTPLPVVCVPGGCGACGGPCNNLSDPTTRVFIQPLGFDEGYCGGLANTVGHEMGHMCGIGADVYHPENGEKANRVGDACGGK